MGNLWMAAMKPKAIGPIIACRALAGRDGKQVRVILGRPRRFPGGNDYYCPYQILGIGDERIRHAGGIDAIQALQLTLMKIGLELYTSEDARARALSWDAGSVEGDLGFPVPRGNEDLLPVGADIS